MLLGLALCPQMGAGPWDVCETVQWELLQAAGTWGWAGSLWLGPLPCCKHPQGGEHCQGQDVQPGQREETFPALCSHRLHGDTSNGTVFSELFHLCSLKALNTAG